MVGGNDSAIGLELKAFLYLLNTWLGSGATSVIVIPKIPRPASTNCGIGTDRII